MKYLAFHLLGFILSCSFVYSGDRELWDAAYVTDRMGRVGAVPKASFSQTRERRFCLQIRAGLPGEDGCGGGAGFVRHVDIGTARSEDAAHTQGRVLGA